MSFELTIPKLNGEVEAGVAVGIDPTLPEAEKLPILTVAGGDTSPAAVKQNAVVWAYKQDLGDQAKRLLMNGVAALIDVGFLCKTAAAPDGDWRSTVTPESSAGLDAKVLSGMITLLDMQRALSIVVATKANWWMCNHHTGQGAVQGYAKKVLNVQYGNELPDGIVDVAHKLGHFASTKRILTLAGVAGCEAVTPVVVSSEANVKFTADAKLRFESSPAGTHRHEVAFQAAKRLVRSAYARFCPGVGDFATLALTRAEIRKNRARFHIGASYLTGQPRMDFSDTTAEDYLGRLGAYILKMYSSSSLAKSPHMEKSRVEGYPDYDPQWATTLQKVQLSALSAAEKALKDATDAAVLVSEEAMQALIAGFR